MGRRSTNGMTALSNDSFSVTRDEPFAWWREMDTGGKESVHQAMKQRSDGKAEESSVQVPGKKVPGSAKTDVVYGVEDAPPWYLCIVLGLQHYLTMFGGTIAYPYIITPYLCMRSDDPARGYIISSTFFVSGIVTFFQSTFGVRSYRHHYHSLMVVGAITAEEMKINCRIWLAQLQELPIVQGSSMAFLVPVISIMNLPEWKCPTEQTIIENRIKPSNYSVTEEEWQELWQERMRLVQGSIVCAAVLEVAVGLTGIVGLLLRWITPLSILPTIALVGLPLFAEAAIYASGHWGISFLTIMLLALFSQYLRNVEVPCCSFSKTKGCNLISYPFFKLFPVLLTITLAWAFCAILTVTSVFPQNNSARTDLRLSALYGSPWFRFPYPGQWGWPTVSTSAVLGILAAIFASIVESIGDYYACARLSGAPPPPMHAINRGIAMEGFGCILSGLWGTGSGTTSFSENIGAIGITKVGSRRVIQYGALIMILFGMLSKFGAFFVTIPEPIIGGVFCIMFSMVTAVGLSNAQYIDLNSTRNLFVLGISLFLGLCLPKWIQANPTAINTGVKTIDQILLVLLGTGMFVGGFFGILLDNTIPGTDEERGITKWRQHVKDIYHDPEKSETNDCYELPFSAIWQKWTCCSYIPFCSNYKDSVISTRDIFARIYRKQKRSDKYELEIISGVKL